MSDLNDSLRTLLSAAVERKVAPGLVAVVTNRTGEIAQSAVGYSDSDKQTPLGLNSSIWLASMSKAVVSLAALVLVEKHKFDLDSHDELIKILPELKLNNGRPVSKLFAGKNEDGTIKLRDAKVGITLRHLLSHTSGLPYEWSTANSAAWFAETGTATLGSGSTAAYDTPREFEAGTGWTYGAGADWVGRWVERISKSTLRRAMQDLVLTPLGVPADSLDSFVTPKMNADRSAMHFKAAPGTFVVIPFETPQFEKEVPEGMAAMASAPLHGTLLGFSKIIQCLLDEGRPLLSPAMWKEASSDACARYGISLPTPLLASADSNTSHSVDRFIKPADSSSTLGEGWTILQTVFVREKSTTGLTKGSLTWAGLANSNYFVCPDLGIGGCIAAQILPWADPEMNEVIEKFQSWTIENFAK